MTQLSYNQAVKLVNIQQREITRLQNEVAQVREALDALSKETRGSIMLNWYMVDKFAEGQLRVPAKDLIEISPASKFGYRFDEMADEYVFTAHVEIPDEATVDPSDPAATAEVPNETVEATYEPDLNNAGAEGEDLIQPEPEYSGPKLVRDDAEVK